MKTCYECKQQERNMFNMSMQTYNCEEPSCEFYIAPKETKMYALFTKEEKQKVEQKTEITTNKKFDLEIKIKQHEVRILETKQALFNLETTRDNMIRELQSL